jgi:two-component system, cell cycle response regulator CtrA
VFQFIVTPRPLTWLTDATECLLPMARNNRQKLEMPMRVLIVAYDVFAGASIRTTLVRENFICDTTDLSQDGLEIDKLYDYDIILLDPMLPDIEGYKMLQRLRAARVRTPILILSGRGGLDHKIQNLGFGADDFLTKPFDDRELIARIQAIVRRSKGHSEAMIRTGKLIVNLDTRVVSIEPVHLTGKEYGILSCSAYARAPP